jgi:hypothetical protein
MDEARNPNTSHSEMRKVSDLAKKANLERQQNHARENLKRHIQTKFKTTMIGSLAKFEEAFGRLWGHGVESDQLTEEQKEYRELWQLVRTEILNQGNNQLRASLSEVDNHTVTYNKMEYKFLIKDVKKDYSGE